MRESSACICNTSFWSATAAELGAGRAPFALPRFQRGDRAADARARDELMGGLDRGDDGLPIGDLRGLHREALRGADRLRRQDGEGDGNQATTAHRMFSGSGLDIYIRDC